MATQPPPLVDLVLSGGLVVTMDDRDRVLSDGAVAIDGTRIVAVDSAQVINSRFRAKKTLDTRGQVVMPGLINCHSHAPMSLLRGVADDLPLNEWLQKFIFPLEARYLSEDFVRLGTRLALIEMIRGGTTSFVDMYYFEDIIAEEAVAAGMRGTLGQALIDFPVADAPTWQDGLSRAERHLQRWSGHPLITPAVAPHSPYTVSPEHLRQAHELAKSYQAPYIIHLAEAETETKILLETRKKTPVRYLNSLGVLDPSALAVHMVWLDEDEVQIVKDQGVSVAHCPESNLKLVSGIAPVPSYLREGVPVGLGTDGAASNNDLDLWGEMSVAAKLHKWNRRDPTVVSAHDTLSMTTRGAAVAAKLTGQVGVLGENYCADIICLDANQPHWTPMYNVKSHLVYSAKSSDVVTTIVNGRVLMEGRKLLTLDEPNCLAQAREWGRKIQADLG